MRLYAIADLHLRFEENRRALAELGHYPHDWLAVAGDVGETEEHLHLALGALTERFAHVLWTPGNHELWTLPSTPGGGLRGEAKYRRLVAICRSYGVSTPEDPYRMWPAEGPPRVLAPLFLLYDYSFRPDSVTEAEVLDWALETDVLSADEALLHPDPHLSRAAWCAERCRATAARLARAAQLGRTILINHFPLREDLLTLARIPRFSPWCGTRQTEDWHTRYNAEAAIYGHLHVPRSTVRDGVRFEEVSFGYPRDHPHGGNLATAMRQILPPPSAADSEA